MKTICQYCATENTAADRCVAAGSAPAHAGSHPRPAVVETESLIFPLKPSLPSNLNPWTSN